MSEIVFLNMADDLHVDGHKAVEALRNKYPATGGGLFSKPKQQVVEVQMVPIYRAWKKGQPLQRDMAQIKTKVAAANKVMLSVHGPMKEVDHALIRDQSYNGEQPDDASAEAPWLAPAKAKPRPAPHKRGQAEMSRIPGQPDSAH